MPDFIGTIPVPETVPVGVWPLFTPWGVVRTEDPQVQVHTFGTANHKREQRYLLGAGTATYQLNYEFLTAAEIEELRGFWEEHRGSEVPFTLQLQNEDGTAAEDLTVRFESEPLRYGIDRTGGSSLSVTLRKLRGATPEFDVAAVVQRFPTADLAEDLLAQDQEIIPLVTITMRKPGYPVVRLSDRRCLVNGDLFHARLREWGPITQSIDFSNDQATFVCGDADHVMRDLAESVDLRDARIEFAFYHVQSETLQPLWKGLVYDFDQADGAEQFVIYGTDSAGALAAQYPFRILGDTCQKVYADGPNCPGNVAFAACDKSWGNCVERGLQARFGGVFVQPQQVLVRNNGKGAGRQLYSPTSQINDSVAGATLKHIYTDAPMPVTCEIIAGREESDFYAALGVVGKGPLSGFQAPNYGANPKVLPYLLDGQPHHGAEKNNAFGLRRSYGHDPVLDNDPDPGSQWFSLGQGTPETFGPYMAAGVAFVFVRRSDPPGMDLSRASEHTMQAGVSGGLRGWYWADAETRLQATPNTSPIWIAVNGWLEVNGLEHASAADQKQVFDVESAMACAALCADVVDGVFGGTETQFRYRGVLAQSRDFKIVLEEVLANCLGYAYLCNGKLKFGMRTNASVVEAFGEGNVLLGSARLRRMQRDRLTNRLVVQFLDSEQEYKSVSLSTDDEGHRKFYGSVKESTLDLRGTVWKSQAARIAETRRRELCGGINEAEWRAQRAGVIESTALAIGVEPGMVISYEGAKFRVIRITWSMDFKVRLEVETVTDSMYDLAVGPKPPDVVYLEAPEEVIPQLTPGDIRPIGSNAFEFVNSVSEDGNLVKRIAIAVTYDPPFPKGTFSGVSAWLEGPDGNLQPLGDQDYNGDGSDDTPGRYGTCRFLTPPPQVAEVWRLYLVSRSPAFRKRLRLSTETDPTPYVNMAVDPVDPIASEPEPPAENVASVSAAVFYVDYADGATWGVDVVVGFGAIDRSTIARADIIIRGPQEGESVDRVVGSFVPPPSGDYLTSVGGEWIRQGSDRTFTVLIVCYNADNVPTAAPLESADFVVEPVDSADEVTGASATFWSEKNADGNNEFGFVWTFTQANIDTSHTAIYIQAFDPVTGAYREEQLHQETKPGGSNNGDTFTSKRGQMVGLTPESARNFRLIFYTVDTRGQRKPNPPIVVVSVGPGTAGLKANRLATSTLGSALSNNGTLLDVAAGGITNSYIANLAVDNAKLQALSVDAAKLQNSAVTATKIANAAVGSAAIALLAVGSAHIQALAVGDAQIGSVSAGKITAGTISAAVSMTAPNITSTSGSLQVNLSSGRVLAQATNVFAQMQGGECIAYNIANSSFARLGYDRIHLLDTSGGTIIDAQASYVRVGKTLQMGATNVINTSGQFIGPGVDVGANGINALGYNVQSVYFGQTLLSGKEITDLRDNAGTLEYKFRVIDYRGGIKTFISAESAWTPL